jgi:hypothetical protein
MSTLPYTSSSSSSYSSAFTLKVRHELLLFVAIGLASIFLLFHSFSLSENNEKNYTNAVRLTYVNQFENAFTKNYFKESDGINKHGHKHGGHIHSKQTKGYGKKSIPISLPPIEIYSSTRTSTATISPAPPTPTSSSTSTSSSIVVPAIKDTNIPIVYTPEEQTLNYGTPSSLVYSPPFDEYIRARRRITEMGAPGSKGWDGGLWSNNRDESVARQHELRDALGLETLFHVSRLAATTGDKMVPCKRFVVSVATIPSRVQRLYNMINALRRQNYPPDQVLIALPPFATRLKQEYNIPDFIKNDPFVKLVDLPADFGPLSKVAAALYNENDPETCIMTVDDDGEPREFTLELMVTWAAIFHTSVVAAQGWNVSCITGRVPYHCPADHGERYMFVRNVSNYLLML